MNTLLWIVQGFLCITFFYSGTCKMLLPVPRLVSMGQTGVGVIPLPITRFIGFVEIAGSVGLILPWLIGKAPVLTPVSAGGFAIIMLLAFPIHYRLKEPKGMLTNVLLLVLSLFVAWGRCRML